MSCPRPITRILAPIILAFSLLTFSTSTQAGRPAFLASVRPLQALLPITSMEGEPTGEQELRNICTTTSINKGYWISAGHCVGNLEKHVLDTHQRYIDGHIADVVAITYDSDLSILVTADYSLPAVKLATHAPSWLDPIVMAGHPLGYDSVFVVPGTIANPYAWLDKGDTQPYMLFSMPVAGGNSGSCIFNDHGEVVSIMQIGFGRGFVPVSGGAPYWHLRQFASKYFAK